jgi:hypothetical protein
MFVPSRLWEPEQKINDMIIMFKIRTVTKIVSLVTSKENISAIKSKLLIFIVVSKLRPFIDEINF